MYKITETNDIIKMDIITVIFNNNFTLETDPMYMEYKQWVDEGNIAGIITQEEIEQLGDSSY